MSKTSAPNNNNNSDNNDKPTCFTHNHMSPAEYGLWAHAREVSHKTGVFHFSGDTCAERFQSTSRASMYRLLNSLKSRGWFRVLKAPHRTKGGFWSHGEYRPLSHDEWAAEHPAQCAVTSLTGETGDRSPVPKTAPTSLTGEPTSSKIDTNQSQNEALTVPPVEHKSIYNSIEDKSIKDKSVIKSVDNPPVSRVRLVKSLKEETVIQVEGSNDSTSEPEGSAPETSPEIPARVPSAPTPAPPTAPRMGNGIAELGRLLTPREVGTNPRQLGVNPRATGTNPRAAQSADWVAIARRKYSTMKWEGGNGPWMVISKCPEQWRFGLTGSEAKANDVLRRWEAQGFCAGPTFSCGRCKGQHEVVMLDSNAPVQVEQ